MTSENMMSELRRIVGVFVEEYDAERAERAKVCTGRFESDRAAQAAIFGAYSCGMTSGISLVLVELSRTFGIDLRACEAKEGAE